MAVLEPKMQSGFLNVAMYYTRFAVLLPSDLPFYYFTLFIDSLIIYEVE